MTNIEDRLEDMRLKYLKEIRNLKDTIKENENLQGPDRYISIDLAERIVKMQEDMIFLIWMLQRLNNRFS